MNRRTALVFLAVMLCPFLVDGKTKDKHKDKKKEKHPMPAQVVGRYVFYEGSAWGDTIATDKSALLPGQVASFINYISYDEGMRGLFVDVDQLADPGAISAADFLFHYGNDNEPVYWAEADPPNSVSVNEGGGVGGSDRIKLTWNASAIPNSNWLAVTVLANANTGLAVDDIFYFGLAIGETGDSEMDAMVTVNDVMRTRDNESPIDPVPITSLYDHDRSGKVTFLDVIICESHMTDEETCLKLITPILPSNIVLAALHIRI